ncbi:MAG: hypothetical protein FJ263_03585 [Planctomycetes bacterium]|nr:hypothetical protein [Planctomycetota bacterium]
MTTNTNHKSICSVSELAKKLGLSRARFYQLQKTGVFPEPVYCLYTRRPFYPIDLQERCIEIRKTGIGNNGRQIIFYNTKKTEVAAKPKDSCDPRYTELSEALEQTGLKISPSKVRKAIVALYPDNWQKLEIDGKVIAAVFRYFRNGV